MAMRWIFVRNSIDNPFVSQTHGMEHWDLPIQLNRVCWVFDYLFAEKVLFSVSPILYIGDQGESNAYAVLRRWAR